MDFYVRTRKGEYRRGNDWFTRKWTKVPEGQVVDAPELEIVSEEDFKNRYKGKTKPEVEDQAET